MALLAHPDFAYGLVANSPGLAGTDIQLLDGLGLPGGDVFPDPGVSGQYVLYLRKNDAIVSLPANTEKVLVTAKPSDNHLTVTRGYDGSTAQNADNTYQIYLGPSTDLLSQAEAWAIGKNGGQDVIGGLAASESLTLKSTAHATKGRIKFGASAYDEVNDRLGIGIDAPSYDLQTRKNKGPGSSVKHEIENTHNDGGATNVEAELALKSGNFANGYWALVAGSKWSGDGNRLIILNRGNLAHIDIDDDGTLYMPAYVSVGVLGTDANGHLKAMNRTVFNVRDYGAVGDGSTDDAAAIVAAATAAYPDGVIYFPTGVYRSSGELSFQSVCRFDYGARIKPDTNINLLFSKWIDAPDNTWLFELSGTSWVAGLPTNQIPDPRWWRMGAYGSGLDSGVALTACLKAQVNAFGCAKLVIPEGVWWLSTSILVPRGYAVEIVGQGNSTVLAGSDLANYISWAASPAWDDSNIGLSHVDIHDFRINAAYTAAITSYIIDMFGRYTADPKQTLDIHHVYIQVSGSGTAVVVGILSRGSFGTRITHCTMKNVNFTTGVSYGIHLVSSGVGVDENSIMCSNISDCNIIGFGVGIYGHGGGTAGFEGCIMNNVFVIGSQVCGIRMTRLWVGQFNNLHIDSGYGNALWLEKCNGVMVSNCWINGATVSADPLVLVSGASDQINLHNNYLDCPSNQMGIQFQAGDGSIRDASVMGGEIRNAVRSVHLTGLEASIVQVSVNGVTFISNSGDYCVFQDYGYTGDMVVNNRSRSAGGGMTNITAPNVVANNYQY